jgi:phosphate transport system ATP-binding protein
MVIFWRYVTATSISSKKGSPVELLFYGVDIYAPKIDPVAVRRHIGMVFQQPNPFSMSIYDNVAFGLRLNRFKGNIEEKVEYA